MEAVVKTEGGKEGMEEEAQEEGRREWEKEMEVTGDGRGHSLITDQ